MAGCLTVFIIGPDQHDDHSVMMAAILCLKGGAGENPCLFAPNINKFTGRSLSLFSGKGACVNNGNKASGKSS